MTLLAPKELLNLLQRWLFVNMAAILKSRINPLRLALLHFVKVRINGVLGQDPHKVRLLLLSDAVDARKRLLLEGFVPPQVDEDHAVCDLQV